MPSLPQVLAAIALLRGNHLTIGLSFQCIALCGRLVVDLCGEHSAVSVHDQAWAVGMGGDPWHPVFNLSACVCSLGCKMVGLLRNQKRRFTMLDDVSGTIHPGRLCLLLGPPGTYLSTLVPSKNGAQQCLVTWQGDSNHERNDHTPDLSWTWARLCPCIPDGSS